MIDLYNETFERNEKILKLKLYTRKILDDDIDDIPDKKEIKKVTNMFKDLNIDFNNVLTSNNCFSCDVHESKIEQNLKDSFNILINYDDLDNEFFENLKNDNPNKEEDIDEIIERYENLEFYNFGDFLEYDSYINNFDVLDFERLANIINNNLEQFNN